MTGLTVHGQADTPPNPPASIDPQRLAVLRHVGPADGWGLLPAVVAAFAQEGPMSLAEMREAVRAADGSGLEQAAHRLKGAAANIGAIGVVAVCQQLQHVARSTDDPRTPDLVDQLEAALCSTTRSLLDAVSEAP